MRAATVADTASAGATVPRRSATGRERLVVVGNGMAGVRTVEEILRRTGTDRYDITIFGEESYPNYNRILLSNVLAGTDDISNVFINSIDWYARNGVTLRMKVRVTSIDRWAKKVFASDGTATAYDKLIIATGSRPYFPPIAGMRDHDGQLIDGVFGFRTLDDCKAMLDRARLSSTAVVIGGGLLGLEAARGMLARGLEVHLVHGSQDLMNQQLDSEAAGILRSTVHRLGITVHLNKKTSALTGAPRVKGIIFEDGSKLDADMVVVTTGVRPNAELAAAAGLTVQRAVVTDDTMRSVDDPSIYAVGECAEHRGQVYGLVAPLWEQAAALADNITSHNTKSVYLGSKIATKLKVMGVELATMGLKSPTREDDEVVKFLEPKRGVYKSVVLRDDKLIGATLLGDLSKVAFLLQAFDQGTPMPEERHSLLFDIGAPDKQLSVAELPDDTQVCNCNGVDKATLVAAVNGGHRSLKGVMSATRAGTGCGSCKDLISDIVELACGGSAEEDPSAAYYVPCIPLAKPELIRRIREMELRSVSAVFDALSDGAEDAVSKPGVASLLHTIWGNAYEDQRDARFVNDRVHANIQRDGTFSVVPRMPGGVTSPDQLRRIADAADKYRVGLLKVTGGQRIDLLGVKKEDLPGIWSDLGMESGFAYGKTFRTCKTCVGIDFCRYGLGDSTSLGISIDARFRGIESPAKMKLAVSGCPRNCAESLVKDVGVVGIEGGRWEIYVGGSAGSHIRRGELLAAVESHDEVLTLVGRFIQYYRENAKYLERPYAFAEREGIARLRSLLVDNSEGICDRLDSEIQASVEAYSDPWQEGSTPVTANQFGRRLPVT